MNSKGLFRLDYILLLLLFTSCVSSTTISILHPGQITLPIYIDTIGIENRVISRTIDDPYLSQTQCVYGDNAQFTSDASNEIIQSLFAYLGKSPRFKDVVVQPVSTAGSRSFFPDPLDTITVQQICRTNHVRALMMLESFFCNSEVSAQLRSYQVAHHSTYYIGNTPYTRTYYTTTYYYTAQLSVVYSVGIRLYGQNGTVLDEYRIDKSFDGSARSATRSSAINNLPTRSQVINRIRNIVADLYTHRISPLWGAENRIYLVNDDPHFKMAQDSVLAHNWNGAAKSWLYAYQAGRPLRKAEAAYNLALASEVNEDFPKAVSYLNEALAYFQAQGKTLYANRAMDYLNTLQKRQGEIPKLNQQMGW